MAARSPLKLRRSYVRSLGRCSLKACMQAKAQSLRSLPSHHRPAAAESFITITNPHGVGSLQLHQPPARGTGGSCHQSPWAECYIHTTGDGSGQQQPSCFFLFFNGVRTNYGRTKLNYSLVLVGMVSFMLFVIHVGW